jgi:glyoxylase-like metal-dependent hydrolase (beta-lactamase superfamily II)
MGDAFAGEWPATLEALKQLDFEWVIPGHGEPYQGKAQLENFQAYLRDFWEQVSALHAKGVSVEDAASRIDMTKHKGNYPQIQGVGVDVIPVRRAYEVLGS